MHDGEFVASPALVRQLLREQMPEWAGLRLSQTPLGGTDNTMYRLGDDMVVRLPRIHWAVKAVGREFEWLPKLAPLLHVEVPIPRALGKPGSGYPWPWAVYGWLSGEDPSINIQIERDALFDDVVRFIRAIRGVHLPDSPPARAGLPLVTVNESVRRAIRILGNRFNESRLSCLWEAALAAPNWAGAPVWVHADLDARNVLVARGRLKAVIDWGSAGLGDPAFDVACAWRLFSPPVRAAFRARLDVDDATWARARGWALGQAVSALSYYTPATNRILVNEAGQTLAQILAEECFPSG